MILYLVHSEHNSDIYSNALRGGIEETASNVLHSLAYFQISCFDPQQLKCYAYSLTSFCLSKASAHVEGTSHFL